MEQPRHHAPEQRIGHAEKKHGDADRDTKKTLVGIGVVTLVAAVALDGLGAILLVPATYLVLNLLEEYVVVPFVIGHRLLLNPVVFFVWLIFWGWLWGVPGALMAVPLLAIVKIVCDHVQPLASLAEFIEQ